MTNATQRTSVSRRSFIITATAFALSPLSSPLAFADRKMNSPYVWKGSALGAEGTIKLFHPEEQHVRAVIATCRQEISRLEKLFSLYREDSAVAKLNRVGFLDYPDIDFVTLVSKAIAFSEETEGLFDISVQPLWRHYADFYAQDGNGSKMPSRAATARVLDRVGYKHIEITSDRIQFNKPGMALTFNGIAQGYITDRIKTVLEKAGFENVLLSLGEIYALGSKPDGKPWQVGLEGDLDTGNNHQVVPLENRALATSGGYASPFSNTTTANHLLNPLTGNWSDLKGSISVVSSTATQADMISTALALMTGKQRAAFLAKSGAVDAVFYAT